VPYRQIRDPAQLHALIDAILTIEVDAELSELLQALVDQATALIGARFGALGVLASDGEQLAEFITAGIDDPLRRAIGNYPVGKGLLRRVIADPRPIRIDHLSDADDRAGFPPNHPQMDSLLAVPVRLESTKVFGNLYFCDKLDGTPFTESDEGLVETLGLAAGLLIDKVRLRAQLSELTLTEERERMARNLHDTVIQRLFAVGLSLQSLTRASLSEDANDRISRAVDDLDETIREIRTTIFAISRPQSIDSPSIRRQVLALCDEVGGRLGLHVDVSFIGPVEDSLSSDVAEQLLVALREALSNVVRHADAESATVEIAAAGGGITLEVADDGRGPSISRRGDGQGLRNLSVRASRLGGFCELAPRAGGGSTLVWHVTRTS